MGIDSLVTRSAIGFLGSLAALFIGLKLTGLIVWSWLWVLAPLWIPLALVIVFVAIALLWTVTAEGLEERKRKREFQKPVDTRRFR